MLNGVGRTLKEVALKHDVLVRNHDSPRETLIELGTVGVHIQVVVAEETACEPEQGEHHVVQQPIGRLSHERMASRQPQVDVHREFSCEPL